MSKHTDEPVDEGRRRFLRDAARWTVALTLGGGLVALLRAEGDDKCPQPCATCPGWHGCRKPQRDPQAQRPVQ